MDLETIHSLIEREHRFNSKIYYTDMHALHEIMYKHFNTSMNNINEDFFILSVEFEELSEFYLMYALYAKVYSEDAEKNIQLFGTSAFYSYGLLHFFNQQCTGTYHSVVLMRKAVYLWSSLFLVKWDKESMDAGNALIDSLNKKGSIIRYGSRLYPESWFLIDLFSIAFDKPYDKEYADYPESMSGYSIILDQWDSEHLSIVDEFVTTLCDMHLRIEEQDNDEPEFEYLNFSKAIMAYYPYIVIGYLRIRERKGLKNPKTFTHPLMNTPIAKMFLNIKEPLLYPQELPYAKELLEKLKEQCPDVEIPEWLKGGESDGLDRKEAEINKQNNAKGDDIIPDDFFAK